MPEVVKADGVGETRLAKEGLEGAPEDVVHRTRAPSKQLGSASRERRERAGNHFIGSWPFRNEDTPSATQA